MSTRIEITMGIEYDKVARDFTASIASAYRLATSKVTLLDINNYILGLVLLLKHKRRLRKLFQETRDPACTTYFIGSRNQSEQWPEKRHLNGGKQK
jgi:hypothetical protein